MPRGRRASPGPRPMARAPAPVARAPPRPAAPAAGGGGPGLMGQMAATAGGVAIGSAIGHGIGNMMSGGGGGAEAAPQQAQEQYAPQQQQQPQACEFELRQFLECTQRNDLSMCEAFNQTLKDCRTRYGI